MHLFVGKVHLAFPTAATASNITAITAMLLFLLTTTAAMCLFLYESYFLLCFLCVPSYMRTRHFLCFCYARKTVGFFQQGH